MTVHHLPQGRAGLLRDLARPAVAVSSTDTCTQVESRFGADPALASMVVLDESGRIGLISRSDFTSTMAGPYGYGRALHAARAVADLADWSALVLSADTDLEQTVQAALGRSARHRYDEILVLETTGELSIAPAAAAFDRLAAEYGYRVMHEPLTGLANRELFLRRLDGLCSTAGEGAGACVAVVYVDLDRFKAVNDTLGHEAGDVLLRAVAERLRTAVRPGDLVARLGGDEFAVLVDLRVGSDAEAAAVVAEVGCRLSGALAPAVEYAGRSVVSSASIGISVSAHRHAHAATLLREADLAMYAVKRSGGAALRTVLGVRHALAGPGAMSVDDSLLKGLRAGQFRVHYQPIIDLRDGEVVSLEALVRWQHPERGLLQPVDFLAAAEANGSIVDIGGWVLEQACRQAVAWAASGLDARSVNVNVSLRQLLSGGLLEQVSTALTSSGLPPPQLRLELPETATVEQLRLAESALTEIRARGVRLTLDDVGAGASSLRHLSSFDVDGIKIDRSFIATMLTDRRDMAVVRMLIELADALAVAVTAEGVETPQQRDALMHLGCGFAQGYLFARPAPPEAVDLSPRLLTGLCGGSA